MTQTELDMWYDRFCKFLHSELKSDSRVGTRHATRKSKLIQPYWNQELDALWVEMRGAERTFLKCKPRANDPGLRDQLKIKYKQKQYMFDKRLKFFKRKYQRGQILHLDQIQTGNPNYFGTR